MSTFRDFAIPVGGVDAFPWRRQCLGNVVAFDDIRERPAGHLVAAIRPRLPKPLSGLKNQAFRSRHQASSPSWTLRVDGMTRRQQFDRLSFDSEPGERVRIAQQNQVQFVRIQRVGPGMWGDHRQAPLESLPKNVRVRRLQIEVGTAVVDEIHRLAVDENPFVFQSQGRDVHDVGAEPRDSKTCFASRKSG
jgi:hypothetical protein